MTEAAQRAAMQRSSALIEALQRSLSAGAGVERIETHCAWVLLAGEQVWKIKKPVDFGFLDYSTLEKRRFFCEEEIRLNRRFAPEIYLDVVAIGGEPDRPVIGGQPVLEYAVHMRRFPDDGLLSQLAEDGRLQAAHIDQLVERIAEFHRRAARAEPDSRFGEPRQVHHWVRENFEHIRPLVHGTGEQARLEELRVWVENERQRIEPLLRQRKQAGFVRECHGDLHLGNITLIEDRVTPFDCIEFNPELRWIDVFSEVAFLVMDLEERGYREFAFRFLNGYLQAGGDYQGLGVLRYYLVYRSLVRAKVAVLRRAQAVADRAAFDEAGKEYRQYMELARRTIAPPRPQLLITYGLSGSGKSTLARALAERLGMIQVRSDVERKRLAGLDPLQRAESEPGQGLYTRQRSEQTYARLGEICRQVVEAGYPVIADAAFLDRGERSRFRELAAGLQVPFVILACSAPLAVLESRIGERRAQGRDPSDATTSVLHAQLAHRQPPGPEEADRLIEIDTSAPHYLADALAPFEQGPGQP